jgi:hypothetical protein
MIRKLGYESNETMVMTLAYEWAAQEKSYSSISYAKELESRYMYTDNDTFAKELEYAFASKAINVSEYNSLKKYLDMSETESVAYKQAYYQFESQCKEIFGNDKMKSDKSAYFLSRMMGEFENKKYQFMDMMRRNGGAISESDFNSLFGGMIFREYEQQLADDIYKTSKKWSVFNGYMPSPLADGTKSKDAETALVASERYWEAANNNAAWFFGDEYMNEALITMSNNTYNKTGFWNNKNALFEFTSQYIFGVEYSKLPDNAKALVCDNALVAAYQFNSFVDLCKETKNISYSYSEETGGPLTSFRPGIVSVNVDGGSLGILDTNTGDVWWYGDVSQSELKHKKMGSDELKNRNYKAGYESTIRLNSSALKDIE